MSCQKFLRISKAGTKNYKIYNKEKCSYAIEIKIGTDD